MTTATSESKPTKPVATKAAPKKSPAKPKAEAKKPSGNRYAGKVYEVRDTYNPRVTKNIKAWELVQSVTKAGKATGEDLYEVLKEHGFQEDEKDVTIAHADMIGYLERGKHLKEVK